MVNTLIKAAENFIAHQLREVSNKNTDSCLKKKHLSTIDLITSDGTKKAYFYYTDDFLQSISHAMLCEETTDSDALVDLINETTNLIAGSAKIVGSDHVETTFDIGIPSYGGVCEPNNDGTFYALYINDKLALQLGVKD